MMLSGTRFGDIEIEDARVIALEGGLLGFPAATRFVLLTRPGRVGWLQSLDDASLAFPVLDGASLAPASLPPPAELARAAGLATETPCLLVIAAVKSGAAIANFLAPVVIDDVSGKGRQIVLDPERYSARTPVDITAKSAVARP